MNSSPPTDWLLPGEVLRHSLRHLFMTDSSKERLQVKLSWKPGYQVVNARMRNERLIAVCWGLMDFAAIYWNNLPMRHGTFSLNNSDANVVLLILKLMLSFLYWTLSVLYYQFIHSVLFPVTISITNCCFKSRDLWAASTLRSNSKVSLKSRACIFPYTVKPHSRLGSGGPLIFRRQRTTKCLNYRTLTTWASG